MGLILSLSILFVRRYTVTKPVAHLGFFLLAQASALLVLPFLHSMLGYGFDAGYFSLAFQILAGLAVFYTLANTDRICFFAKFWVNLHIFLGGLGLAVFIAGLTLNIQPLDTFLDRPYYDFGLSYTNVFYQIGGLKLIRIASFYDEPGTFAFYLIFALVIARLFQMPKWKEVAIILLGQATLSMAFIVVTLIWICFSVKPRQLKYLVLTVAAFSILFARLDPEVQDYAYQVTVDRFSVSESGNRLLKGDNRSLIMKENYQAFLDSPMIGHGGHYEEYVGNAYHWSFIGNPMAPFAIHGIFGALVVNIHAIVLLVVLLLSRRLIFRDKGFVLLTLLATLAQRPTTINGLGYVLFVIMIFNLIVENSNKPRPASAR